MNKQKTVLITGGSGFIGSAVVRQYLADTDVRVVNVDKLTYAGSLKSLGALVDHPNHHFERVDICDATALVQVFREYHPDAVMHLAAESHVDRSINGPADFINTNILGTYNLLEVARGYWNELNEAKKKQFKFHHVSTDEVYGDLEPEAPAFTENSPYAPSSPYSASKASSDHLVRAWARTYGLPAVITNCSNNYGPYQFPEKLIPLVILNAVSGKSIPVYGNGQNVRDWLYVEDHAAALRLVLEHGSPGETYNIGASQEAKNIDLVKMICRTLDRLSPRSGGSYEQQIEFVTDRPGHDRRYAIDAGKIRRELGWKPVESLVDGLEKTVAWYLEAPAWLAAVSDANNSQGASKS